MTTRRRLLSLGAGGTAALAVGSCLGWFKLGYRNREGDVPIGLSAKQLVIVRAAVEAIVPADGDLPGGIELGIHQRVDEEVWAQSDDFREDFASALQLLEHTPPLFGYLGRFSHLSLQQREAFLNRILSRGPRLASQALNGLRQLVLFLYYSQDPTWPAIGYDGPWIRTERPPESARAYAELLHAAR